MRCFAISRVVASWHSCAAISLICFAAGASAAEPFAGMKAGEERAFGELKMKFCWCPPAKFKMGSSANARGARRNENQVDVTMTQGFWLGKYEVTQEEYDRVMGKNPSFNRRSAQLPVELVSWEDATAFCDKLTAIERTAGRLADDWEYRLPTEAQWEYACRAGTNTTYSFGADAGKIGDFAWYGDLDNAGSKTHEVGQKKPNAWGLHDMHGNVWEWCQDVYTRDLPGGEDPVVAQGSEFRVARGGSWFDAARVCTSSNRSRLKPTYRNGTDVGFRVAAIRSSK